MQIQLKQLEIETALKAYITGLGINLTGKTVTIAFTSGRKDNGLSADIEFEDAVIPGYNDGTTLTSVPTPSQPQQAKPALSYPVGVRALDTQVLPPVILPDHVPTQAVFGEPEPAAIKPVSLFSK